MKIYIYFIIFSILCSCNDNTPLYQRILWYEKGIGIIGYAYGGNAFDGYDYEWFDMIINDEGDTIIKPSINKYPDKIITDSIYIRYTNKSSYSHGWFFVKNEKIVDLTSEIKKEYYKIYGNHSAPKVKNGIVYSDIGRISPVYNPLYDYGKILGVSAPYISEKFCIYKYNIKKKQLYCISSDVNYSLVEDGIYFIPFPGRVLHEIIPLEQKRNEILEEGTKKDWFLPSQNEYHSKFK